MKSIKYRLSIFMMLTTVFALGISGTQSAMANPGFGTNDDPNPAPFGGQVTLGFKDSGDGPYDNLKFAMYEPGHTAGQVLPDDGPAGSACTLVNPQPGLRSWRLMFGTINGAAVEAFFDLPDNSPLPPGIAAEVKVKFGLGSTTVLVPTYLGSLSPALQDPAQAAADLTGVFFWRQFNSAGTSVADDNDALDVLTITTPPLGDYRYAGCGGETNSLGVLIDSNAIDHFATQSFVAGSILPINTVSLLVAGILASSVWILPTIGVVSAAGISIYKINKKQ